MTTLTKLAFGMAGMLALLLVDITPTLAASPLNVVIGEVGWSGTQASTSDEWMELRNNTSSTVDLAGWTLSAADGTPNIILSGNITAGGYFLLERTADTTISNISADQVYTGFLSDGGETLELKDATGNIIDSVNSDGGSWPGGTGGSGTPPRASMERISSSVAGVDSNWTTNDGIVRSGVDAGGNPINGTPKAANSQGVQPTPTSAPTAAPTSTPTPKATSTPTPTPKAGSATATVTSGPSPTPTPAKKPTSPSAANQTQSEELVLGEQNSSPTPTPQQEATGPAMFAGVKTAVLAGVFIVAGLALVGFALYSFLKKGQSARIDDREDF